MNINARKILEFLKGLLGGFACAGAGIWIGILMLTKGTLNPFIISNNSFYISADIFLLFSLIVNIWIYKKSTLAGFGFSVGLTIYILAVILSWSFGYHNFLDPVYFSPPVDILFNSHG